ncbi:hypothetical protein EAH_00050870 [Eimeria acervulina]|uniref:Uncharacterized protein n=1 Tax=Eimeria acervulina TaxID=5801 RepID=U6GL98_EIMAC|nr:hypothetical protein EAH_00050870 [Eimeria acervulina]CDI80357.1 hypothetical protein EAH_00050870 [Eimeria acervulina]
MPNRLVGIYKTFDATKSVTLDPSRITEADKQQQQQQEQQQQEEQQQQQKQQELLQLQMVPAGVSVVP